ncbi:MAG: hypothetical protein AB8H80_21270 [Planctomycetota bacterium]
MQRFLLSLSVAAFCAHSATAQSPCFEQNFGVLAPLTGGTAGFGDDVMFDVQPLNFNYPTSPGTTYSHLRSVKTA